MKLNELVCPTCGLKCMTDAAYTTCASCQTFFYASQSRSVDDPTPVTPYITWPTVPVWPYPAPSQPIQITPIWIAPYGPPGTPHGPQWTCETTVTTGGSVTASGGTTQCQVWN